MTKNKGGFTLIELLIVVAILGLLTTIAVVFLQNARSAARDTQRVSDIKQIQKALEMYHLEYGHYPVSNCGATQPNAAWCNSIESMDNNIWIKDSGDATAFAKFMPNMPTDPLQSDVAVYRANYGYFYFSMGDTYALVFRIEDGNSELLDTDGVSGVTTGTGPCAWSVDPGSTSGQPVIAWGVGCGEL